MRASRSIPNALLNQERTILCHHWFFLSDSKWILRSTSGNIIQLLYACKSICFIWSAMTNHQLPHRRGRLNHPLASGSLRSALSILGLATLAVATDPAALTALVLAGLLKHFGFSQADCFELAAAFRSTSSMADSLVSFPCCKSLPHRIPLQPPGQCTQREARCDSK